MDVNTALGVLVVLCAGISVGSMAWPMKLTRKYQFEHWWLIAFFVGLVVMPWGVTFGFHPGAAEALAKVPLSAILLANLFGVSWGIANVLFGICIVRIGVGLTGAIVTGLGVSVGVTLPMIMKGSGLFSSAPGVGSAAGLTVLLGVAVMICGVILASVAGMGRDKVLNKEEKRSGSALGGIVMAIIAGVLSCGFGLTYVYGQGPVVAAMKASGSGDIAANAAVWAVGFAGAALVNILYPAYLLTKNGTWKIFRESPMEGLLAPIMGIQTFLGVTLMGKGMLLLGALGASVGFGMQQASQMMGSQGVGFIGGEWRGVTGKPRTQMYLAICLLVAAACIMAYGNTLAGG